MSWIKLNEGTYSPSNKVVLDSLSDVNGSIAYKGIPVTGGATNVNLSVYKSNLTDTAFNYYNVLDNGIVADGATDNTVKMQALVDSISSLGGGTIYAPMGTYFIGGAINWKSNVSLIGDGKDLTIFKASGSSAYSPFYQIANETKNISFQGFTVDGYNVVTPSYQSGAKAFFFQKITNGIFRDLKLVGTGASALGIDFLQDVIIDNVTTIDCGRQWATGGAGGAGIGIGTGTYPIENLTITNCKTYNSGHFGIFLEMQELFGQGNQKAKGVTIDNCIVVGGRGSGIGIRGGENITISNCQSYENTGYGIWAEYQLKKIKLSSNTVSENTQGGIGVDGSAVINDLMIDNNIVSSNGNDGIALFKDNFTDSTVNNLTVTNNHITNNTGTDIFVGAKSNVTTIRIKHNENINNAKNSSKLYLERSTSYAMFPYQLTENPYNEIILQFKLPTVSSTSCLFSVRNTNFMTSNKVQGFSVNILSGNTLQITGYKTNDATTQYIYNYNEVFTNGQKFYLRVNYASTTLQVQYSTDGVTYTPLTLNTGTSTGIDDDIIAILGSAAGYSLNIGREWSGNLGWTKPLSTLVLYLLKVSNTTGATRTYEYRFCNVGYNNEIYEITGTKLNGRAGLGAIQMGNEIV